MSQLQYFFGKVTSNPPINIDEFCKDLDRLEMLSINLVLQVYLQEVFIVRVIIKRNIMF